MKSGILNLAIWKENYIFISVLETSSGQLMKLLCDDFQYVAVVLYGNIYWCQRSMTGALSFFCVHDDHIYIQSHEWEVDVFYLWPDICGWFYESAMEMLEMQVKPPLRDVLPLIWVINRHIAIHCGDAP